jgi:hypothetical protein
LDEHIPGGRTIRNKAEGGINACLLLKYNPFLTNPSLPGYRSPTGYHPLFPPVDTRLRHEPDWFGMGSAN